MMATRPDLKPTRSPNPCVESTRAGLPHAGSGRAHLGTAILEWVVMAVLGLGVLGTAIWRLSSVSAAQYGRQQAFYQTATATVQAGDLPQPLLPGDVPPPPTLPPAGELPTPTATPTVAPSPTPAEGTPSSTPTAPDYNLSVDIKLNGSDGPLYDIFGIAHTLMWNVQGRATNGCTASGAWSGPQATSGSQAVTDYSGGQRTYTLTCSNELVSRSDSVTLYLQPPIVVDLQANGSNAATVVRPNTWFTMSWQISGDMSSCSLGGAFLTSPSSSYCTNVAAFGCTTYMAAGVYTYTLQCTDGTHIAISSVRVDAQ